MSPILTVLALALVPSMAPATAPHVPPAAVPASSTAATLPNGVTGTGLSGPAPVTVQPAFHDAMRKLWEDHVTWTRLYIVSAVAGLPDADRAAERLLQNQSDIGNAIKPFYGEAAGEGLTALLRPHILIAAEIVKAAKAGDAAAVGAANARWSANADEIADFLHKANPQNWPQATLRAEMHHHLDLTLQEATARIKGDWAADIAAYDKVHDHILGMADVLSAGIVRQFPRKFRQ